MMDLLLLYRPSIDDHAIIIIKRNIFFIIQKKNLLYFADLIDKGLLYRPDGIPQKNGSHRVNCRPFPTS